MRRVTPWWKAARLILAFGILSLSVAFRETLESTMALHMLVQIPAILIAGLLASDSATSLDRRAAPFDEHGITGLSVFMLATAFWMIPRALELASMSPAAEFAKFVSLFVAGGMLRGSFSRANTILRVFFVGNLSSMTAIAGLLYQDAPQRLCNLYLYDDQLVTGTGLVVLAVVMPVGWVANHFIFSLKQESSSLEPE